jgi:hypothetical protein
MGSEHKEGESISTVHLDTTLTCARPLLAFPTRHPQLQATLYKGALQLSAEKEKQPAEQDALVVDLHLDHERLARARIP